MALNGLFRQTSMGWHSGTYVLTSTDAEMHAKLEMLVKEAMEQYNNKIKEKEREKKIKKNK